MVTCTQDKRVLSRYATIRGFLPGHICWSRLPETGEMFPLHSQHNLSDADFENAIFVRADEPTDPDGGITITFTDYQRCAPEPLRLVVLLHWRACEQDGRPRSAESVWSALTERGIYSSDGETPVSLGEVRQAVDFLLAEGLVTAAEGGDR